MSNAAAEAEITSPKKSDDKPPEMKEEESSPRLPSPTPSTEEVEHPWNRRFVKGDSDVEDRTFKRKRSPSPQQDRERLKSPSPKKPRIIKDRGRGSRRRGYDHGYRLHSGGRDAFTDERPYVWPWYQNDFKDWESVSDGGNREEEASVKSFCSHVLMSFKQFMQHLDDDVQPSEAERRYNEYQCEYVSEQKKSFFELNKEEEWLKDRYHPANLLDIIERRNFHAIKASKDFLSALLSETLILHPCAHVFLKVRDMTKKSNGGRGFWLRKPAPKAHPISSEPRRVLIDTKQAQALIRKLDSEKGIEKENILTPCEEESNGSSAPVIILKWGLFPERHLKGTQLLDVLTSYLWSIHGLDYYGMVEKTEPKGVRHVRSEVSDVTSSDGAEWEKYLDSHWKKRLDCQDPWEVMAAQEKIAAVLDPYLHKNKRYTGCGVQGCTKLFSALKYALEHLYHDHPELEMEQTSKIQEDQYLENYMTDPNAPGSKLVMQKTMQVSGS